MWLLCIAIATAQTKTITGKISSSKGEPVAGAAIQIKGKKTGTTADMSGAFSLSAQTGDVLIVSAINYVAQEIKVGADNSYTITLTEQDAALSEVVVTALGIKREKKSLAYAVQTVGSDQINKSGTGNPLGELNGKVSGLTVINSAGDPGAGTYIRLRGVSSLTGNNQPLMVVDGVPIDNSINNFDATGQGFQASGANGNLTGGAQSTNRGVDLNPNDIESITVLKGPAATALYGIQAASGALIITTKKGSSGGGRKLSVSVSSSYTADKVNKLPERQGLYAQGDGGAYLGPTASSSSKRLTWGPAISTLSWDGVANDFDPHGNIVSNTSSSAKIPVTPYDAYDFFKTGGNFNNSIAVASGNEKSGFRMSLGNIHQTGIIPLTKYNKSTFTVSGQSEVTKRLSIAGSATYITSGNDKAQQGSNTSGIMLGLLRTPTTFDNSNGLKDAENNPAAYVLPNGTQRNFRGSTSYDNPYWTVNRTPTKSDLDRVLGYGQVNYQLLDWMTLSYRLGGDVYTQADKSSYDIYSGAFPAGAIYMIDYQSRLFNSNFNVNMRKTFNDDFSGSLIVGHDYFTQRSTTRYASGTGLVLPNFLDMSNATSYLSSEGLSKIRRVAYYGQAELSYKQMYFLTLTGRSETTSTLSPGNNNFFYPSASLGWVFTELEGLKANHVLSYGKVRVSYAQVGKDAPTQALKTYYKSAALNDGFTNGITWPINSISGFELSSTTSVLGNPDLVAEKDNSYELGLDLSFVQNRINLSATYYHVKASNQIFTVPIAYTTGFASVLLNAGEITNRGLELSLNTTPIKAANGLRWDLNFNWATNSNKVVSLREGVGTLFIAGFTNGGIYAIPGQSTGNIYGTDYIRTSDGKLVINDVASDDGYGMPIVGTTSTYLGSTMPKWTGSAISNLSYKGFTLGAQVDVRHGGKIWNGTKGAMSYFGTSQESANRGQATVFSGVQGHLDGDGNIVHYSGGNEVPGAGNANTPGGQSAIPASYNQYYWQNIGSSFVGPTSINIEDGSFVRIRQISLTYALPKSMLGSYLNNLSLTVFANNPKLWTDYSGVDPETSLAGPANGQGLDYFNNPGIKSWGVRLNVGL